MRIGAALWMVVAFAIASLTPAAAQSVSNQNINVKWYAAYVVHFTLTPNYAAGFGTILATFGPPGTPAPGPNASFQGGSVDFGTVKQGNSYLYRYAAHVNVTSNAPGLNVYAEGTADFTGTGSNAGNSLPINQTIYYLQSTTGGGDPNTGFSPSTPFLKTTQTGASYNNPNITYTSYPAPAYVAGSGNVDYYFDYQLKLPSNASLGAYYVYVAYTVVPT